MTASAMYDPSTGRWISRDPIKESGGLNLYAYTQNSPLTFSDAAGLDRGVYVNILHNWLEVDMWDGKGHIVGRAALDFSPANPNYQLLTHQQEVTEGIGLPFVWARIRNIPSTQEADTALLIKWKTLMADKNAPQYNLVTHNCIHNTDSLTMYGISPPPGTAMASPWFHKLLDWLKIRFYPELQQPK